MKYKLVFVLSALRVGGVSLQDIDIQLRGCERAQGDSAELPSLSLFRVTEGRRVRRGQSLGVNILLFCWHAFPVVTPVSRILVTKTFRYTVCKGIKLDKVIKVP